MKVLIKAAALILLGLLSPALATDYDFDLNAPGTPALSGPIELVAGDTARFVINEQPSTGYIWHYLPHEDRGIPDEEAVYTVELDEYREPIFASMQADGTAGDAPTGVMGTRVIQIRAQQAGSDTIEMVYVRPWEIQEGAPLHTNDHAGHHVLKIEVSPAEQ